MPSALITGANRELGLEFATSGYRSSQEERRRRRLWLRRKHELADQAATEVAASGGSLDPLGEGIAARRHKLSSNHIPRT